MGEHALTEAKVLEAAVAVLRRHGPGKTTVVEVAALLGVSHGSIYRFFPSKQALRDAVVRQWLDRVVVALEPLSQAETPAPEALLAWFRTLRVLKLGQVRDEPELFEAYRVLTTEARAVLLAYKAQLYGQIGRLVARGMSEGAFASGDPDETARALWVATLMFHHPAFSRSWGEPEKDREFEQLWRILMEGIVRRPPVNKE